MENNTVRITSTLSGVENNLTPIVAQALRQLTEQGGGTLSFAPGEYHFYREGTQRVFLAPTNNNSGDKDVVFSIFNAKNITVDGGNARFVFHGTVFPFAVTNSRGITLKNIVLDTHVPSAVLFTVKEKGEDGFLVNIDRQKSPYSIKNGCLSFDLEDTRITTAERKLSLHSLDRLVITYLFAGDCPATRENLAAHYHDTDAEEHPDGIFFRYRKKDPKATPCPFREGERVAINLEERRDRDMILLADCEAVTVENLTIHRSGGMGILAQCCHDLSIHGFRVKAKEGDHTTLTADALHLVNCSGVLRVTDCEIRDTMDDAMNIHGVYTLVQDVQGNRVRIRYGHVEQSFFNPYHTGDRIRFIDPTNAEIVAHATVEQSKFLDESGMLAELTVVDFDSPEKVREDFLVDLPDRHPHTVEFCHNYCENAPHVLMAGGKQMRFADNTLVGMTNALNAYDNPLYWYESGRIGELIIENNRFIDCKHIVIRTGVSGFTPEQMPRVHGRLIIRNNQFTNLKKQPFELYGFEQIEMASNLLDGAPLEPTRE